MAKLSRQLSHGRSVRQLRRETHTMVDRVQVAGVGVVPFATPRRSVAYDVMAQKAIAAALADAGLEMPRIQQAYAGYVYGDSTCGQNAVYRVGMTGSPVINVNNNCSTGS